MTFVELAGNLTGITTHHSNRATDGVIKAEVSGKTLFLIEFTLAETGGTNPITAAVKKKDGTGAIIYQLTVAAGGAVHVTLRKWREGDAYDGANAGDLYLNITGTGTLSADWIVGEK